MARHPKKLPQTPPPPQERIWTGTTLPQDIYERADTALARLSGESRSNIQKWMKLDLVSINGKPIHARDLLPPDSLITIRIPASAPRDVLAEDLPLTIVHEDSDILVLNKAAGMHIHPGAGRPTGSLAAALLHHCDGKLAPGSGPDRPGIVHRLDRETTGLIVAAKNDAAHRELSRQFRDRETEKTYIAFVLGRPRGNAGTWEGSIGRHPVARQRMAIRTRGRAAKTDWKIISSWPGASLLELNLHTGRTHQIRVHSAEAGCPVAGDTIYGGVNSLTRVAKISRQLLHAQRLGFTHPRTGEQLSFLAPPPADFTAFQSYLDARRTS